MKKILAIFLLAFFLNALWENIHSVFYINYKKGNITEAILLRAALADALYVTGATIFVRGVRWLSARPYIFLVPFFIILAVSIEWWALSTHRWTYSIFMPILPLLNVGLSPTIQLAIMGCVTYWFIFGRVQK